MLFLTRTSPPKLFPLRAMLAALGVLLAFSGSARAATLVYTVLEQGGDVIVEVRGAPDLEGYQFAGLRPGNSVSAIQPELGAIVSGPAFVPVGETVSYIIDPVSYPIFGTGDFTVASSGSGTYVGFVGPNSRTGLQELIISTSYESLDPIGSRTVFSQTTLAALGIREGFYSFLTGNNTIEYRIGASAIPLPLPSVLFLTGAAVLAGLRETKRG